MSQSRSKTRNRTSEAASAVDAVAVTVETRPLAGLEALLGYRFSRPELLELALTHRSFPYEARMDEMAEPVEHRHPERERNQPGIDNEQLEFLGDAVLGLAVTEALFAEFPQCTEGELTRLRATLVSRKRMAEMGVELGLGEHLRLGRSAEQNGGRRKPALLANTAEAVIAALYLDALEQQSQGVERNGLAAVRALVEKYLLKPERATLKKALAENDGRGALRDHKTLLQERVQAEAAGRLRYIDIAQSGPAHQRLFAVEAQLEGPDGTRVLSAAEGPSKKEAQQRAAELAMANWAAAAAEDFAANEDEPATSRSRRKR